MVPYDQPEAALVCRYRASRCVEMLTYSTYSGHDYPMGQEYPLELIVLSSSMYLIYRYRW